VVARHLDLSYDPAMIRPLAGFAVLVLVVGGATGCSRGNELETAYNGCIDNFSDSLPEQDAQLDVGAAEDYLSYDDDELTDSTPTGGDAKAASAGAAAAVTCVMRGLDAPADATRQAATGDQPGKASWSDFSATWETQGVENLGLTVTQD
jgi:hypothetical protein